MHRFAISTSDGILQGFLVLTSGDETDPQSKSGACMLQLHIHTQAEVPPAINRLLSPLAGQLLTWHLHGDSIGLCDAAGRTVAGIHQQYLRLGGETLLLSDLEGNL